MEREARVEPGGNSIMAIFPKLLLSVLFAAATFFAIIFIFTTMSIIESFQLYPHDATGGLALFLIEMVIAFTAASVGGLLCLHRLWFGYWFPGERHQRHPSDGELQ
jgi:hypothetical protein